MARSIFLQAIKVDQEENFFMKMKKLLNFKKYLMEIYKLDLLRKRKKIGMEYYSENMKNLKWLLMKDMKMMVD